MANYNENIIGVKTMTFYKANYDTKETKNGIIVALTSKRKKYIKKRLLAFGIEATKIYNIQKQFED